MTADDDRPIAASLIHAEACLAAGNSAAALDAARRVLARDPEEREALELVVRALLARGDLAAADKAARELIAAHPDEAAGHRLLSLTAHDRKMKKLARAEARKAVALEPEEPANHLALALAAELADDYPAAEESYRKSLELMPGYVVAKTRYADFLLARGRKDEARALVAEAGEEAPDDIDVIVVRGLLALRDGHVDKAHDHAVWALGIDAMDPSAVNLLAQVKMRKNPVLGLWWRYAVAMGRFSFRMQILIVVALYFGWRLLYGAVFAHLPQPLPAVLLALWLGFCVLTWLGPSLLKRMVRRELKAVRLRKF